MSVKKETIQSLIQYFLSLQAGNDVYALRYHALCLIYKLCDMKLNININEDDLYNLQFNYEHFVKNIGNTGVIRMSDYLGNNLTSNELEIKLQKYLNIMFMALSEVLKKYGFENLGLK